MTIQNKAAVDDSISWGELAELTHATQVEKFGFCSCEDAPKAYPDCPRKRSEIDDMVDSYVNTLKDGQDGHDADALDLVQQIIAMGGEEATDGECLELILEVLTEWKRYI
jgi:hypothetical protein